MSEAQIRIAHLILAHKSPAQIERLIRALDHPQVDFFIHLDKKAKYEKFAGLTALRGVHFIRKRVDVGWGCYSLVQAELNGLEEIVATNRYDYINVLSGQDFPLRSAEEVYRFFLENRGDEFISCEPYSTDHAWWQEALPRVRKYNFQNWKIPGKYRIQFLVNRLMPDRRYPLGHELAGRSQWMSITVSSARYILQFLKDHPEVVRYFKYVWGADEFIFSTILYNSPFRKNIRDNLMYTDWSRGEPNPKLLTTEDFPLLQQTDKIFARKFDMDADAHIFTLLEDWTKANQLNR